MSSAPTASRSVGEAPLAVICGAGSLPFAVADAAIRRGRGVVLFALHGAADPERTSAYPHYWFHIGQAGRFLRLAGKEGCRDVVMIGPIIRPSLWQLLRDFETLRLLPRLARMTRGGDGSLLEGVAAILEERGLQLVAPQEIAPELLMPEGTLGTRLPSERARVSIARGLALLDAIGPFDVGQAAVMVDEHVLAVEAAEGTDYMLARVAELRRNGRIRRAAGGVLVKAPKSDQDRRLDLPTIGPQTIEGAARAALDGIALVAGSSIVAEPERIGQVADREKLFVVGVRHETGSR
jgi:UDP-2,3-diacylglucosamine hydrolase